MKKRFLIFAQMLPVIFSMVIIAAHFLRVANYYVIAFILVILLAFLFVHKPIIARITQGVLALAACEWIRTTYIFASIRMEEGKPWIRLVIILATVACFTLASAFVFMTKTLKEMYGLSKNSV